MALALAAESGLEPVSALFRSQPLRRQELLLQIRFFEQEELLQPVE
jgi:hypothetical protein